MGICDFFHRNEFIVQIIAWQEEDIFIDSFTAPQKGGTRLLDRIGVCITYSTDRDTIEIQFVHFFLFWHGMGTTWDMDREKSGKKAMVQGHVQPGVTHGAIYGALCLYQEQRKLSPVEMSNILITIHSKSILPT